MRGMTRDTAEQIAAAYRRMAKEAKYRPAAPSDGMGHIVGPLNLNREARAFITGWWEQEDTQNYWIGCPGWEDRPALIYTTAAAQLICGKGLSRAATRAAVTLLRMAADELER